MLKVRNCRILSQRKSVYGCRRRVGENLLRHLGLEIVYGLISLTRRRRRSGNSSIRLTSLGDSVLYLIYGLTWMSLRFLIILMGRCLWQISTTLQNTTALSTMARFTTHMAKWCTKPPMRVSSLEIKAPPAPSFSLALFSPEANNMGPCGLAITSQFLMNYAPPSTKSFPSALPAFLSPVVISQVSQENLLPP